MRLASTISILAAAAFAPTAVSADEADARTLLKAMSDYMGAQQTISFSYDSTLAVVTGWLATSGAAAFTSDVVEFRPNVKPKAKNTAHTITMPKNIPSTLPVPVEVSMASGASVSCVS